MAIECVWDLFIFFTGRKLADAADEDFPRNDDECEHRHQEIAEAHDFKSAEHDECGGGKALHALSECYSRWADEKQKKLDSLPPKSRNVFKGDKELIDSLRSQAADYQKQAEEWMLPEGD